MLLVPSICPGRGLEQTKIKDRLKHRKGNQKKGLKGGKKIEIYSKAGRNPVIAGIYEQVNSTRAGFFCKKLISGGKAKTHPLREESFKPPGLVRICCFLRRESQSKETKPLTGYPTTDVRESFSGRGNF